MAEHKTAIPANKRFLTATDVAELLNDELNKAGKITMAGKVSAKYFYENTYL